MQPQVLELKDIHYLSKLVNGIYILAKNYRWFIIIFHTAKGEKKSFKKYKRILCFHFTENLQKNYPCEKR